MLLLCKPVTPHSGRWWWLYSVHYMGWAQAMRCWELFSHREVSAAFCSSFICRGQYFCRDYPFKSMLDDLCSDQLTESDGIWSCRGIACRQRIPCWSLATGSHPGSDKASCRLLSIYIQHNSGFTMHSDGPSTSAAPLISTQTAGTGTVLVLGSPAQSSHSVGFFPRLSSAWALCAHICSHTSCSSFACFVM